MLEKNDYSYNKKKLFKARGLGSKKPFPYAMSIITDQLFNKVNKENSPNRYSPLFKDEQIYNCSRTKNGGYGNIWIKLTGDEKDDFRVANEIAYEISLYPSLNKTRQPNEYTWHHVYMGWISQINQNGKITIKNGLSTTKLLESITPKKGIISHGEVVSCDDGYFDASKWKENLRTEWNPLNSWSLLQLVKSEYHHYVKKQEEKYNYDKAHKGSAEQYRTVYFGEKNFCSCLPNSDYKYKLPTRIVED